MRTRLTVYVVAGLALLLVFGAAAPAASTPSPTAPTNLRITASSPTSVSLAWDKASSKSSSWWYCVQRDGLGCFRVDPPRTTFTHPNLWPNTTYRYSVVAISSSGKRSAPSNTVSYTTPPDTTAPSPPPVISTTAVYPTRIYLTWTQSRDNVSQVSYTLEQDGQPVGANQLGFGAAMRFELTPETTYTFRVTASDAFGNSVSSNTLSVTTPAVTDRVPPTAPSNLRLSSESSAPEIWLDWDPSTDDTDPQSQILYDVYVNGVRDHAALGAVETIVYCQATGPNRIVLQAVDTSGNVSGLSNEIVFDC